ncbi:hypothetical protein A3B57_01160 [Microgenomates group bacterium RIFCSPLOWO2_01_FULL_47_10]|nr:MAG: hypothetical protein A3B57_01160 [Microgenomates group bacterium RIFCSPLOWO2_01_FULL_47_10]
MLSFSRKADYGLLFLTVLAGLETNRFASVRLIARQHKLPYTFMAKIANQLKEAGILESREGIGGGFRLKDVPDRIPLNLIVKTLDGPVAPVACMQDKDCACAGSCTHSGVIRKMSMVMEETMADYTLADLVGGKA